MIDLHLIDYKTCHDYARTLCGQYGIPLCDAEDIGSDAFLLSIRRAWRTGETANERAAARRLIYTSVVDVIRRRNNKSFHVLSDAEGLYRNDSGDDMPSDDEVVEERFAACDKNQAEEHLTEYIDWQNPFWLRLFNSERQKLRDENKMNRGRGKQKNAFLGPMLRVIRHGLKDSRLRLARNELKISGARFQVILGLLQDRFSLCFQALRAWRG